MRCERAQELFSEYCEGAIQAALRVPLESHLAACARCREEVDGLRHVWTVLDSAPRMEAPAGFRASVWQRIDSQETSRSSRSWLQGILPQWKDAFMRRPYAWAAGAGILLVLASAVVPGRYTPAGLLAGLFRSDNRSQFVAALPQIAPGGEITVPLTLQNSEGKVDSHSVPIQVRVLSGPVTVATSSFVFNGRNPVEVKLVQEPAGDASPVVLEVRRLDGGQPSTQILTIPLPN